MGRNEGSSDQQLLDLAHFETSPAFSELEKLVLRYAVAMTNTPVEVPDELFAELRNHFSPQQMVELTSAFAWEYYRAGNVDLKAGLLIAAGFLVGGYFGGIWAQHIPEAALRRIFGTLLVIIGIRLLLSR